MRSIWSIGTTKTIPISSRSSSIWRGKRSIRQRCSTTVRRTKWSRSLKRLSIKQVARNVSTNRDDLRGSSETVEESREDGNSLLTNVRRATTADARLMVVESVIPGRVHARAHCSHAFPTEHHRGKTNRVMAARHPVRRWILGHARYNRAPWHSLPAHISDRMNWLP